MRVALLALCATVALGTVQALAQTVVINTDQTSTVNLPAGGGTVQVDSGVTVQPSTGNGIVGASGDVWALTNYGAVLGNASNAYGVDFQGAGSSVNNFGQITGNIIAVNSLSVSITNQVGATLQGDYIGISFTGQLFLVNDGSITGTGLYGINGSLPNAGIGTIITNSGLIQGSYGINLSTGSGAPTTNTITNQTGGMIIGTSGAGITNLHGATTIINEAGGLIQGATSGINGSDAITDTRVDNSGTIAGGTGAGVRSYGGGTIINRVGGIITGAGGVAYVRSTNNSANELTNAGTITATSPTFLAGNGTNAGSGAGVYIGGVYQPTGTLVTNLATGVITGTVYGIYSGAASSPSDAGPVTVSNAGDISGNTGISFNGAVGTVVNSGTITGSGGIAISFDQSGVYANSVTLDTGSVLNGNVLGGPGADTLILRGAGSEVGDKFINFETLLMRGSDWTLSGDSTFSTSSVIESGILRIPGTLTSPVVTVETTGTLAGTGTIIGNVTNFGTVAPGNSAFGTLMIAGNYVGQDGTLAIRSVLGDDTSPSDRLAISGSGNTASGSSFLHVDNIGGTGAQTTGNGILVVDVINGTTTAAGAFTLANPELRAGLYDYRLFQGGPDGSDPNNWYLRSDFVEGGGGPDVTPPDVLPPEPPPAGPGVYPIIGPEIATYGVVQPMAQQLGRSMLGTHDERSGDLNRLGSPCEPNGDARRSNRTPMTNCGTDGWRPAMWGRLFGQQIDNRYQAFAEPRADGRIAGFQTGFDVVRSDSLIAGHKDYAGVYFAYGNANVDVSGLVTNAAATDYVLQHTGRLNLNAFSGGVYWTHFGPQGGYLDLVLQGTSYSGAASTEFARLDTTGAGFTSSLEGGYPIALPMFGPGFVLEPQAQILWQYVNFDAGNDGLGPVALGTSSATTARLGLKGKWAITTASGQVWQPYVRANVWSDFGGNPTTMFGPVDMVPLISHAQYMDVDAGLTTKINAHLTAFTDAGYQFAVSHDGGGKRDGVKGTAGLRYQW